jgi:pimeloyl-ACP methyl ester carboxylesterase
MTDTEQANWTEGFFTVEDGTKLHYAEMGAGTPVILIHGAGGSAIGNWFINGIAPALAATNRVIGIDMRGHGLSEAGPKGGRRHMAADVIAFMDAHGIDKAHIGGYSMGGFVTAGILAAAPDRFITASFGGSGLVETDEWADRLPADRDGAAPEESKAQATFRSNREVPGQEVGNARRDEPATADAPAPPAVDPRQMRVRQQELAAAIDLPAITFPVLAINGEFDRPYAKTHRLWRQLRNFTNVVLPDKGHLSAVMRGFIPQEYIDAMVKFITSNNPTD